MASETEPSKPYYTIHRNMVKDIIVAFDDFFARNLDYFPPEEVEIIQERLSKKQWKYITKIVEEAKL